MFFLFHVNPSSVKFATSLTVQDFEPYVDSTQSEPCSEQKCGAHLRPNHRPRINDQTQSMDFITYLENVKDKESESPPQVLVRCMPETSLALWVDGCETPRCLANCDQKCGILLVHHFLGATSLTRYTNGDVCIPRCCLSGFVNKLNPVSPHYSHSAVLNRAWLFVEVSSRFSAFTQSSSICDAFPRTAPRFVKYNLMRMMERHDMLLGIKL